VLASAARPMLRLRVSQAQPSIPTKSLLAHLGIAAVSPVGAALFLQTFSRIAATTTGMPLETRCSVHHEPLQEYLDAIEKNDWSKVGLLLKRTNELLGRCGARLCVTPDAAVQHVIGIAESATTIPWLSMTDLVSDQVAIDKRKRVGILGTRLVMLSSTFQTPLGIKGIKVVPPSDEDCQILDRIIFEELLYGKIVPESQAFAAALLTKFRDEQECDAVILASSELPLLMDMESTPLPIYQATEILARAAIERMCTAMA
jgi:aspartate racemase